MKVRVEPQSRSRATESGRNVDRGQALPDDGRQLGYAHAEVRKLVERRWVSPVGVRGVRVGEYAQQLGPGGFRTREVAASDSGAECPEPTIAQEEMLSGVREKVGG